MPERLDIPPECFEAKPWFAEFPDREIVREIRIFIRDTGQPWRWRGHTHAPPPNGEFPIYVEEVELPKKLVETGQLAPCPRCSVFFPKWGKGVIAWFPGERVIRILGPKCFQKLNPEAHQNEMDAMRARRRKAAEIAYLLVNRERLLRARNVISSSVPVAVAIRDFWKHFRRTLNDRVVLDPWPHVERGELMIWEDFQDRVGGEVLKRPRRLARLRGFKMMAPTMKQYPKAIAECVSGLAVLEREDWDDFVETANDSDRGALAKLVNRCLVRGQELIAEVRELQSFVRFENIKTLRNWGFHPDALFAIAVDRTDENFKVGRSENAMFSVPIPQSLEANIKDIDAPTFDQET